MTDNNNTPNQVSQNASNEVGQKMDTTIGDFIQNVQKKLSLTHKNIYTIGAIVFAIIFWMIKLNGNVDAGAKLYKEMNKQLNSEIKDLKKQIKSDSLDRIAIFKQIDSLHAQRSKYDQSLQQIDNRLNSIKTGYDKIPAKYTNVTLDSLNKLRTRFGQ